MRDKFDDILQRYYSTRTTASEPVASLMYSLCTDLGRSDNDLLWYAIVGTSSTTLTSDANCTSPAGEACEQSGAASWNGDHGRRVRACLRDEVRRLNPPGLNQSVDSSTYGTLITHGTSSTDSSIRVCPEPKLLLFRHWSLYDSMLHSPYFAPRLRLWSDSGQQKLHKLLAKMGISLTQCKQSYTHMDMELKRSLPDRLRRFGPMYGLDNIMPSPESSASPGDQDDWGFVRCWGWGTCLSAADVATTIGCILDSGGEGDFHLPNPSSSTSQHSLHADRSTTLRRPLPNVAQSLFDPAPNSTSIEASSVTKRSSPDDGVSSHVYASDHKRFFLAYDALHVKNSSMLAEFIPLAQHQAKAILRTGKSLIEKRLIRQLRGFHMAVVKEGPDAHLFSKSRPLIELAKWLAAAIREMGMSRTDARSLSANRDPGSGPLIVAGLDEDRSIYIVVGIGQTPVAASRQPGTRSIADDKKKKGADKNVCNSPLTFFLACS